MKIRIKGPSVRLRLSRTEVGTIVHEGYLEESTPMAGGTFRYALQRTESGSGLSATFEDGKITMQVPAALILGWDTNDLVTISNRLPTEDGGELALLLEKDFQCLDAVDEDQSDNYTNPNKNC